MKEFVGWGVLAAFIALSLWAQHRVTQALC
jgi:hypothetical protein